MFLILIREDKVTPLVANVETEGEPGQEESASAMSSIAEDPSMISDMSCYLSTEDHSIESSINGMSSAEHQLILK